MRTLIVLFFFGTSLLPLRTQLSVHPNPFKDKAVITYTISGADTISLSILDQIGKNTSIFADRAVGAGIYHDTLDLTTSSDGFYFAVLEHFDGSRNATKLIKSKDVSVDAHEPQESLIVFPNPSASGEELYVLSSSDAPATFVITDAIGRTVSEGGIYLRANPAATFDAGALARGIYLLRIFAEGRESRLKVVRE